MSSNPEESKPVDDVQDQPIPEDAVKKLVMTQMPKLKHRPKKKLVMTQMPKLKHRPKKKLVMTLKKSRLPRNPLMRKVTK
ncbi:MAG: hypothetical protein MK329_01235 [Pirellulales bacterium]|nr:hypothetical protein [Pirellulales bacterium]